MLFPEQENQTNPCLVFSRGFDGLIIKRVELGILDKIVSRGAYFVVVIVVRVVDTSRENGKFGGLILRIRFGEWFGFDLKLFLLTFLGNRCP